MYEYESKKIKNYFELKDVIRKATSYFVGSFTYEIIIRRQEWENPNTKNDFVDSLYHEYFDWNEKESTKTVRDKLNCVIRIIESHMVEDAMEYILAANDKKIEIAEIKENAKDTLDAIRSGKLKY